MGDNWVSESDKGDKRVTKRLRAIKGNKKGDERDCRILHKVGSWCQLNVLHGLLNI